MTRILKQLSQKEKLQETINTLETKIVSLSRETSYKEKSHGNLRTKKYSNRNKLTGWTWAEQR